MDMAAPLADRMRPRDIDDMVGQSQLLSEGCALRRIIESGEIPNLIFYGVSGVGKTTLASIIASRTNKRLHKLNCTAAGTADLKAVFAEIDTLTAQNGILLYLDEIQYFNKKQQQSLLEHTENGNITLIASTTENPYFYVYGALLSRSAVFEFKAVTPGEMLSVIERAVTFLQAEKGVKIIAEEGVFKEIANGSGGDVRKAINAVELCAAAGDRTEQEIKLTLKTARQLTQSPLRYDRSGDEHYDSISAFQKSMRGSDPDAAVYYLARILEGGDLPSACRRLLVCACEDVGLAYPQIIPIVKAAVDSAMQLGLPEARIPLADAVILVATAPKSNSAYIAVDSAISDIRSGKAGPVPRHLQNKHFDGEEAAVKGQHYLYPHSYKNHYVRQQYLPDNLKGAQYYIPGDSKNEKAFWSYMEGIKKEAADDKK